MDAEDAAIAASLGADAIIVSNHGGRQLDGAPASVEVLPGIVAEVGDAARYGWTAVFVLGRTYLRRRHLARMEHSLARRS